MRAYLLAALICALALGAGCSGCKDKSESDTPAAGASDAGASEKKAPLVYRRIPSSPLEIKIPDDWSFDDVDPGPEPEAPAKEEGKQGKKKRKGKKGKKDDAEAAGDDDGVVLRSRTLLSARAPKSTVGDKLTAWLMVMHDPFLPAGMTSTDYLDAQRKSNHDVADLKHVEAERSRRQGRPTYWVRDEWEAPLTEDKSVKFSQESLLLLDVTPDGEHLHGYAVVITLPADDREMLGSTLREIVDSVRFKKKR
jgi:hypothetical protein